MASFNHANNTVRFQDLIDTLERQGYSNPLFHQDLQNRSGQGEHGEDYEGHRSPPFDPWTWGQQFFGGREGLAHRGPPGPPGPAPAPHPGPHGPPPPPGHHGPPPHRDEHHHHHHDKDNEDVEKDDNEKDKDNENGEGPSGSGSDNEGGRRGGRHGRCGGRRGRHGLGGRGGFGPHHGGPSHHGPRGHDPHGHGPHGHGPRGHHGPPHHGGPGGRNPWGFNGPFNPCTSRGFGGRSGFDPTSFFNPFFDAFAAEHPSNKSTDMPSKDNEDFTPDADIFDTPSAYIIHISLPGAKKEDVGVNWDAEKSELSVAGVIYRPGDEEFLKTLAMNERKVGPFERKIRLGSYESSAHVDAEGITAKLEDGVLRVEVRKEEEGFVEIRKVDVE